jgi:NAD-dependent dihydropyrimidine dehydrogenase PreA subunit
MKRDIIKIDDEKCNGCGACVPNCYEGALQIIDGKAVLISDLMCDGLGACLGHCPEGALIIEQREAAPYDEVQVMTEMVSKRKNVVIAHLKHLKDHNESGFLNQGINYLSSQKEGIQFNIDEVITSVMSPKTIEKILIQKNKNMEHLNTGGCPGSKTMAFQMAEETKFNVPQSSQLSHWPIQLHLINPQASHFQKSDILVAADCTAFSFGNFHTEYLKNRKLVIACPKLDSNKGIYVEKLKSMIDESLVNTLTVLMMEVPCCGGLLQLVQKAVQIATRKVPVKAITIGIKGQVLAENWV